MVEGEEFAFAAVGLGVEVAAVDVCANDGEVGGAKFVSAEFLLGIGVVEFEKNGPFFFVL